MTDSTLIIIGAAVLLLALVLVLLARTGRKPHEGPREEMPPLAPDQPLSEPGAVSPVGTGPTSAQLTPAHEPAPAALPEALGPPDELTRLKGLGPKAAALLNGMGVTRYDQLAALDAAAVERVDAQMGNFQGRIHRDRWVEQARFLAKDDVAGFEERFGKLG